MEALPAGASVDRVAVPGDEEEWRAARAEEPLMARVLPEVLRVSAEPVKLVPEQRASRQARPEREQPGADWEQALPVWAAREQLPCEPER